MKAFLIRTVGGLLVVAAFFTAVGVAQALEQLR